MAYGFWIPYGMTVRPFDLRDLRGLILLNNGRSLFGHLHLWWHKTLGFQNDSSIFIIAIRSLSVCLSISNSPGNVICAFALTI